MMPANLHAVLDRVQQIEERFAPAAPVAGVFAEGLARAYGTSSGESAQRLPESGREFSGAIEATARRHGLDPALLAALVWHESGFDPEAISSSGAIGLGQLMPGTAASLGVDPHNPVENLDGAARYLREQIERFGQLDLALAAYNAGPRRVAEANGVPAIPETQAYVPAVLRRYEQLR